MIQTSQGTYYDEEFGRQSRLNSNSSYRKMRENENYNREVLDEMESLNYKIIDNTPLRQFYRKHRKKVVCTVTAPDLQKDAQRLTAKWTIYLLLGAILGILAFGIRKSVETLQHTKLFFVKSYIDNGDIVGGFVVYFCVNILYAGGSSLMPMVAGSGIPEVRGYLNGVRLVGLVNIKTFFGKVISVILAFSSCLALGPEGPMVHIGTMIGAGLSSAKSRTLRIRLPRIFERLRSDREQRDFISSGAAAGITAAFGAPIGGVLFALEETASFWSRELTWRTFFGCMVAAFTVNLIYVPVSSSGQLRDYGILTFGVSKLYVYRYTELLPFCLLGVIGGLIGSFFVKMNVKINRWRREYLKTQRFIFQFSEVLIVVSITAMLSFGISSLGTCRDISDIIYDENLCGNATVIARPTDMFCNNANEFNDLANLFMIPADTTLRLLFSRSEGMFTLPSLSIYLVVYFLFATLTAGLTLASGLFVPMMLVGATYGRIMGQVLQYLYPDAHPHIDSSIYALIGSAAMMSGFSRITISLCVILIELTENTQYLLPIMLAVMSAKWVGDALSRSIYEELSELKSIPFLEHHPPSFTMEMGVKDIMKKDPVCIQAVEELSRVIFLLEHTTHNGFPVVSMDSAKRQRTFRGFILRVQLLILLDRQQYYTRNLTTPGLIDFEHYVTLMNHKWSIEDVRHKLPPPEGRVGLMLDIHRYMDHSHVVIQEEFSFMDAYRLFQTQGLRHLTVVNDRMQVVGILTRHDFLSYHFEAPE